MRLSCVVGGLVLLMAAGCDRNAVARSASAPAPEAPAAAAATGLQPFSVPSADGPLWGYRDAAGQVVVPPRFASAGAFREGRARVWFAPAPRDAEAASGDLAGWGFLAPTGEWAIPPRYLAAGEFAGGEAPVLLEGDRYAIVGPDGRILREPGARADAAGRPPLPSADCRTLTAYVEELAPLGDELALLASPHEGEATRRLSVRFLPGGARLLVIGGWEGARREVRLPGVSMEEGRRILRRFSADHATRDVTAEHPGHALALEFVGEGGFAETLFLRALPEGGIEIGGDIAYG